MHRVWKRISEGRDVAVVGGEPPATPPDYDRAVIRVRCDAGGAPLGPWREAQQIAERVAGTGLARAGERLRDGLRRRLLPEGSDHDGTDAIIGALSQVHGGVLVLTGLELAAPATLQLAAEVVQRPGWLGIPILLAFNREPEGAAARLLAELSRRDGPEAVVRISPNTPLNLPRNPHVRLVLRAAALVGPVFDVETVARLVERSPLRVLEALQEAVDHDIALNDLGEGRFELLATDAEELRRRTLPSLVGAWATRLTRPEGYAATSGAAEDTASELGVRGAEPAVTPVAAPPADHAPVEPAASEDPQADRDPAPDTAARPRPLAAAPAAGEPTTAEPTTAEPTTAEPTTADACTPPPADSLLTADPGADEHPGRAPGPPRSPPGSVTELPRPAANLRPGARLRAVGRDRAGERGNAPGKPADVLPFERPGEEPRLAEVRPLDGREPRSGEGRSPEGRSPEAELRPGRPTLVPPDPDQMVDRLIRRAREVAATGNPVEAVALGRQALSLLEQLPPDEQRRRRRIDLLIGLGHLQAEAPGPAPDFSLQAAVAAVEAAESLLIPADPAELRASIRRLLATICYESGDPASLERALALLSTAMRELANAGDSVGAARLLNDQAAVWVRLGDPVRAAHLLRESRGVFAGRAVRDPSARQELAETEHLLARLPLHVRARPGQEADALRQALEHARSAEAAYRALGDVRETARVWETLARLAFLAGQRDDAADWLTQAGKVQQEIGDLLGLARTSDALAALLKGAGRVDQAVLLLNQSVELNAEKGSALGLAYNRRALEALATDAPPALLPSIDAALERLAAAEEIFGRIELPPHAELPL